MSFCFTAARPRLLSPVQSAACHCRQASSRAVTVKLLTTIEGLGRKNEFVQVNPGRMRHNLFPEGKAVYVPWKRRSQLNDLIANQSAAASSSTFFSSASTSTSVPSKPLLSPSEWETVASQIPSALTLSAPASTSSETLFGSIGLPDLHLVLQSHISSAHLEAIEISWVDGQDGISAGKVRKLGKYQVEIGVRGDKNGLMREIKEVEVVAVDAAAAAEVPAAQEMPQSAQA